MTTNSEQVENHTVEDAESPRPASWWLIPVLVFAASFALFWINAAPSVTFHDSGEFALAASCNGLAHPPGAPTWTLLASLWLKLFGFADPARGTNLFSAFFSSITLALLIVLAYNTVTRLLPATKRSVRTVCALVAPLVLLNSGAYLEQSLTTEQYTMLTAFMMMLLLILENLDAKSTTAQFPRGGYILLGLLWGLAVGNHPSQLCLVVPVLLHLAILMYHKVATRRIIASAALTMAGLSGGLLVYLWLPIRARHPVLMDYVRATGFERFWGAITRAKWEQRPLSAIPDHFIPEWMLTYNFIGELGIIGVILALIGIAALVRKRREPWLWYVPVLLAAYGFGMFWAHLRQANASVTYLRNYGVRDWHIPLYLGGAWCAAVGLAMLTNESRFRSKVFSVTLTLICVAGTAGTSIYYNSLRHFSAPVTYIHDLLSGVTSDAILVLKEDNPTHMLAYYTCRKGHQVEPQRVFFESGVSLSSPQTSAAVSLRGGAFRKWYLEAVEDPDEQPLRLRPLRPDELSSSPLYTDYTPPRTAVAPYLLPAGFLYRINDSPTTDGQVVEAELAWRTAHPEVLRMPEGKPNRLEAEARGSAHWQRASFFHERGLTELAQEEYQRSVAWLPNNGAAWFGLGMCFDQSGASPDKAAAAYDQAIQQAPWLKNVRINLAALKVAQGRFSEAEMLLKEELKLDAESSAAREKLDEVQRQVRGNGK